MLPILKRNDRGQLSIFLGITLTVIIGMMAFIINVGMFVKAKINLQNAVDAAAWSGAAVQARQLSNIGYLNWEMRNTYKEWMFKYYVLGQMGLTSLKESALNGKDKVNFRLIPFSNNNQNQDFDKFNLPSTCIHFGSSNNICKIYAIPGLPRFETDGLPSMAQATKSFMNSIVQDKAKNCSTRSTFNMGAAMVWAYGMGKNLFSDMASVAAHRVGAWPQSFELALRMRNLEAILNRPPVTTPLCIGQSSSPGCQQIGALPSPLHNYNERPAKAFVAAFRNLSGGTSKDNIESNPQDQLTTTFTLSELSPEEFIPESNSLSGFLIPSGSDYLKKYYVDLQPYPINLVTFYTHFVASGSNANIGTLDGILDTTGTEGSCPSAKVAIPVPGYIFGFVKNPELVTYYAVKGTAKYVGMMYPFTENEGIELTAYAAAKPYGGRIGPRLFGIKNGQSVHARADGQKRSSPYISYLNNTGGGGTYQIGDPIPSSNDFWVTSEQDAIGGTPNGPSGVRFVLPNLIYNYSDIGTLSAQGGNNSGAMTKIEPAPNKISSSSTNEYLGLYSTDQYLALRSNLGTLGATGAAITAQEIDLAIDKVRRPTNYEALNYLIPTIEEDPQSTSFDALPVVDATTASISGTNQYYLFAPLFGEKTLYLNAETIKGIAKQYITDNESAIDAYVESLRETAKRIIVSGQSTIGGDFSNAANAIYLNPNSGNSHASCSGTSPSMAQKFYQLFKGTGTACGITPLDQLMAEYIDNQSNASKDPNHAYSDYYVSTYYKPTIATNKIKAIENDALMTAYMPGKRQGVGANGQFEHPFLSSSFKMKRNYYSTKFIALKALSTTSVQSFASKEPIYSEDVGSGVPNIVEFKYPSDLTNTRVKNMLKQGQITDYVNSKFTH